LGERADAGNSGPVPAAPSEDSTMDMESSSRANMRVPVNKIAAIFLSVLLIARVRVLRELGSVLRELGSDKLSK
jgi:hypothetical protein